MTVTSQHVRQGTVSQRVLELLLLPRGSRDPEKTRRYLSNIFLHQDAFDEHIAALRYLKRGLRRLPPDPPLDHELKQRIVQGGLDIPELDGEALHRLLFNRRALEDLYAAIWSSPESYAYRQIAQAAADFPGPAEATQKSLADAVRRAVSARPPGPAPTGSGGFDPALLCEEARAALEASSIVVYVADPLRPDDFRIVCMPGVCLPEVMHGFVGRPAESSKRLITDGEPEQYVPVVSDSEGVNPDVSAILARHDPARRRLFASFIQREGVRSRALLAYRPEGQTRLALFVNFSQPTTFDEAKRQRIRRLFGDLVDHLPAMTQRLEVTDPVLCRQIVRIWEPAHQLTELDLGEKDGRMLRKFLGSLLDAALAAFGIVDTGFGTIHLYDRETRTLRLVASRGHIDPERVGDACLLAVNGTDRPGVLPVVALRGKSILIEDLATSAYHDIHRCILAGTRSELGVPMLAHGVVVGVINLESTQPGAFSSDSVRVLWDAANEAALAVLLHRETAARRKVDQLRDRLLAFTRRATRPTTETSPLDELAGIARDTLGASMCDLWHYDPQTGQFDKAGFSGLARSGSAHPRGNGFSHYLQRTGWPVWITHVKDERHFDALYWDPTRQEWTTRAPVDEPPDSVSPALAVLGVKCELGIPIEIDGQCRGVAWLKYEDIVQRPTSEDVLRMAGFAGAAGLACVFYRNGKGPLAIPSQTTMSLAGEFTEQAARLMECLFHGVC
jgi:GAF domain-containing protein